MYSLTCAADGLDHSLCLCGNCFVFIVISQGCMYVLYFCWVNCDSGWWWWCMYVWIATVVGDDVGSCLRCWLQICDGQREHVSLYNLKQRRFIGNSHTQTHKQQLLQSHTHVSCRGGVDMHYSHVSCDGVVDMHYTQCVAPNKFTSSVNQLLLFLKSDFVAPNELQTI